MQFLCQAKAIDAGPLPPQQTVQMIENMVLPSFQIMAEWEREGRTKGGGFVGRRAGAFILEAGSIEEAHAMISSLPFWGISTWSVEPLVSINYQIEQIRKQVERIKNMAFEPAGSRP